ncbi:MAG TPA: hypothetical protein VJ806_05955 [Luteimonas sp.]|nr:hypothetical protein [Luteimonas sp.]
MGEKLDRDLQRALLQRLADAYPDHVVANDLRDIAPGTELRVNIAYLSEHGLVDAQFYNLLSSGPQLASTKISARGLDFMTDDGGLGAILNVQTIRLHEDSVRALLIKKVEQSDGDATVKGKLVDQLRSLPAEGIRIVAEKALEAGIKGLPDAVRWLQTLLN